jgi:hypothetical protein
VCRARTDAEERDDEVVRRRTLPTTPSPPPRAPSPVLWDEQPLPTPPGATGSDVPVTLRGW